MMKKSSKSPALTAFNQDLDDRYKRFAKNMDQWLHEVTTNPSREHRAEVFRWLWNNHAEVVHALERHWLTWDTIAEIAAEDGVKGRWGKPPTGNAMRRVWGRVCLDPKVGLRRTQ